MQILLHVGYLFLYFIEIFTAHFFFLLKFLVFLIFLGGRFVLHTSTQDTINQLRSLDISVSDIDITVVDNSGEKE